MAFTITKDGLPTGCIDSTNLKSNSGIVTSVNGISADARGNVNVTNLMAPPNYNSIVSISSFPYRVPTNGYIKFNVQGSQYGGVSVNNSDGNVNKFQISGGSFDEMSIIPVSAGDVIYSNDNNKGRFFIPCKGA